MVNRSDKTTTILAYKSYDKIKFNPKDTVYLGNVSKTELMYYRTKRRKGIYLEVVSEEQDQEDEVDISLDNEKDEVSETGFSTEEFSEDEVGVEVSETDVEVKEEKEEEEVQQVDKSFLMNKTKKELSKWALENMDYELDQDQLKKDMQEELLDELEDQGWEIID